MNSRQRGELYWRKRNLYIEAASEKGGLNEGYLNRDTADDTIEIYRDLSGRADLLLPTGREFSVCPPSAAGQKYYAESVASLMVIRDRLKKMLSDGEVEVDELVREIMRDGLKEEYALIKRVIRDFFAISGLDDSGNELKKKIDRKEAVAAFKKSRSEYENRIYELYSDYSKRMIEKLRSDEGIEERIPVDDEFADSSFEALMKKDTGTMMLYEGAIEKLRLMSWNAALETAERLAGREALKQVLFQKYYSPDMSPIRRRIVTNAFLLYRNNLDRELEKLLYVRQACYHYANYLLNDQPVDAIISERIRDDINVSPEELDDWILVSYIPGFCCPAENKLPDEEIPKDYESIIKQADLLREYLDGHQGLFSSQCLLSVVAGSGELGIIARRARLISKAADRFTKSDASAGMGRDKWLMIFDAWVVSESMRRVSFPIIEFLRENEKSNVGDASKELQSLLPFINYFETEKKCREVLKDIVNKRSGLDP